MMDTEKLGEWRPEDCGTRIGDIVRSPLGVYLLKVKCRRCSKEAGVDQFHYITLDWAVDPPFSTKHLPGE